MRIAAATMRGTPGIAAKVPPTSATILPEKFLASQP